MKRASILLTIALLPSLFLISCLVDEEHTPVKTPSEIPVAFILNDFTTASVQNKIIIDSLEPTVMNYFATNIDLQTHELKGVNTIFQKGVATASGFQYQLNPIINYSKEELQMNKILVTWDHKVSTEVLDSLYQEIVGYNDDYYTRPTYGQPEFEFPNMVFVSLIKINRYGFATVNFDHPNINDYLNFGINTTENSVGSITLTPEQFKEQYQDAFCGKLTLGTYSLMEGYVYDLQVDSLHRNAALLEVAETVKKIESGQTDWETLVAASKYLKGSKYQSKNSLQTKGYTGTIFGNFKSVAEAADLSYAQGKFSLFSASYLKYSRIYPDYHFAD